MPMKVAFELSDRDLRYFRSRMREVRAQSRQREEAAIVRGARELLAKLDGSEAPDFVRERIAKLGQMIEMLEDAEWSLAGAHRSRVVDAMAYFAESEDLIPDQIPVLGFLDDAIMVELVVQELQPEIRSYAEFCRDRTAEEKRRGREDLVTREEWIRRKRAQGHRRMHERRERRLARGGFRSHFRLF